MHNYYPKAPRYRLFLLWKVHSLHHLKATFPYTVGTGYTAKSLRDKGFTGIIDGVDGSVEMIKVAEKKNLYR